MIIDTKVDVDISFGRFTKQFREAQIWLDNQIMNDMLPYMPLCTGNFQQRTRAESASMAGTGWVMAAAPPFGRFLYGGLVMVDPETHSPWARPGAKKVLTSRPLKYSNPKATSHWFDTAKAIHGKRWVDGVKKRAGGGMHGR